MCKSEIFATIIKIVSMETEVSEILILQIGNFIFLFSQQSK